MANFIFLTVLHWLRVKVERSSVCRGRGAGSSIGLNLWCEITWLDVFLIAPCDLDEGLYEGGY